MTGKKGFTLIELMIVVAIIGVLAAIAVPKFSDLIDKSKEGATKGALASIRGALRIYYTGHEGQFPTTDDALGLLGCLTQDDKYLEDMPVVKLPGTGIADSNRVQGVLTDGLTQADNAGGWFYYDDAGDNAAWGRIVVNCTKEDLKSAHLTAIGEPGHTYTAWSTF